MQLSDGVCEQIAMQDAFFWNASNADCQFVQDISEQTEVNVHMNRFADVFCSWAFERQRDFGRIEMRFEARRSLECPKRGLV
jgi:hypothetical protein